MIWLKDGEKLINNRIVSVNDDALKKFVSTESHNFILIDRNYEIMGWWPFLYESTIDGRKTYKQLEPAPIRDWSAGGKIIGRGARVEILTYRYKKLLSFKMALEAINNKSTRMFDLADFFKDWKLELEKLQTISSDPEFMQYIEQEYADYGGFLAILPYVVFEPIASYDEKELNQLRTLAQNNSMDTSEVEQILKQSETASTNYKILSLTRNFMK